MATLAFERLSSGVPKVTIDGKIDYIVPPVHMSIAGTAIACKDSQGFQFTIRTTDTITNNGDALTGTADEIAEDLAVNTFFKSGGTVSGELEEIQTEELDINDLKTEVIAVAVSDESTAITTGTAKVTFRMPFAMTVTAVRANLNTASSSGIPTVDINDNGTTILSTKLTIDANEKTSTTAAAAAVISDAALADDAEITIDIDVAGTGAKGLKVYLIGVRA